MSNKVKTKSGRVLIMPTSQEDAIVTRAARSDKDAKPLTDAQWEEVKPTLRRGRPPVTQKKVPISIRFDPEVLEGMKSTGRGWQTRVNMVMREWIMTHASTKTLAAQALMQPKQSLSKTKKVSKSHKRDHGYA